MYCDWIISRPNYITDSKGTVVCTFGDSEDITRREVYIYQAKFTTKFGPISPQWRMRFSEYKKATEQAFELNMVKMWSQMNSKQYV